MRHKPSILDNVKYWQVFENEQELKRFMESIEEFSASHIDHDEDIGKKKNDSNFQNMIANHDII